MQECIFRVDGESLAPYSLEVIWHDYQRRRPDARNGGALELGGSTETVAAPVR
jgi:hypothetical protein